MATSPKKVIRAMVVKIAVIFLFILKILCHAFAWLWGYGVWVVFLNSDLNSVLKVSQTPINQMGPIKNS